MDFYFYAEEFYFVKTERPNEIALCEAAQNISNIYMAGKSLVQTRLEILETDILPFRCKTSLNQNKASHFRGILERSSSGVSTVYFKIVNI